MARDHPRPDPKYSCMCVAVPLLSPSDIKAVPVSRRLLSGVAEIIVPMLEICIQSITVVRPGRPGCWAGPGTKRCHPVHATPSRVASARPRRRAETTRPASPPSPPWATGLAPTHPPAPCRLAAPPPLPAESRAAKAVRRCQPKAVRRQQLCGSGGAGSGGGAGGWQPVRAGPRAGRGRGASNSNRTASLGGSASRSVSTCRRAAAPPPARPPAPRLRLGPEPERRRRVGGRA